VGLVLSISCAFHFSTTSASQKTPDLSRQTQTTVSETEPKTGSTLHTQSNPVSHSAQNTKLSRLIVWCHIQHANTLRCATARSPPRTSGGPIPTTPQSSASRTCAWRRNMGVSPCLRPGVGSTSHTRSRKEIADRLARLGKSGHHRSLPSSR
jgi:hypothetical protein